MDQDFNAKNTPENTYDESMPTAAPGFLRLLNYMIDCFFLAMLASVIITAYFPQALQEPASGVFIGVIYTLQFVYYFFFEMFFGRTLAKVLTRTYVTTEFNEKPALSAIFIRTLCRYIPFEYFSFLGNGIGWHDKFSNTYVVRAPKA